MSKIGKEYIIGKPFTPIVTTLTYDELNNIKEDESSIEISNAIIFSVPQDINGYDIENEGSIWLTDNNGYLYSLTSTIKKLTNTDNNNDSNNSNNISNNNSNNENESNNDSLTNYYWYIGTNNPDFIDTIVNDTSSPGWRSIGTTLPSYSADNMLWDGSSNNIRFDERSFYYLVLPSSALKLYNSGGDNEMEGYITQNTKIINNITYYIYKSTTKAIAFGFNIY